MHWRDWSNGGITRITRVSILSFCLQRENDVSRFLQLSGRFYRPGMFGYNGNKGHSYKSHIAYVRPHIHSFHSLWDFHVNCTNVSSIRYNVGSSKLHSRSKLRKDTRFRCQKIGLVKQRYRQFNVAFPYWWLLLVYTNVNDFFSSNSHISWAFH